MANSFYDTVTAAIADVSAHGFDSAERIAKWTDRIRAAAIESLTPPAVLQASLTQYLRAIYQRLVDRRGLLKYHKGMPGRFTIERLRPALRQDLDRRIMASAGLIRLNREAAIEKTLQRFGGWASSVPAGGSKVVERAVVKQTVRKALASLPFEERRVLVDQGHKFSASLNEIVANAEGAIAAIWRHHHVNQPRPEHLERNGAVLLIRGSWAHERGLIKPGSAGYTDRIERPGEWVYCRCSYEYLYNLRDVPTEMLTAKGRAELVGVRVA